MTGLLKELFAHQAWADSAMLQALRENAAAWTDPEVRSVAHHIVAVQRFFLHKCQDLPYVPETEVPESVDELAAAYQRTVGENAAWLARLNDSDLLRRVELPRLNTEITVGEALTQVALHSQGHRSQILTAIRKHGGKPPILDYILWAKSRPAPEWR